MAIFTGRLYFEWEFVWAMIELSYLVWAGVFACALCAYSPGNEMNAFVGKEMESNYVAEHLAPELNGCDRELRECVHARGSNYACSWWAKWGAIAIHSIANSGAFAASTQLTDTDLGAIAADSLSEIELNLGFEAISGESTTHNINERMRDHVAEQLYISQSQVETRSIIVLGPLTELSSQCWLSNRIEGNGLSTTKDSIHSNYFIAVDTNWTVKHGMQLSQNERLPTIDSDISGSACITHIWCIHCYARRLEAKLEMHKTQYDIIIRSKRFLTNTKLKFISTFDSPYSRTVCTHTHTQTFNYNRWPSRRRRR